VALAVAWGLFELVDYDGPTEDDVLAEGALRYPGAKVTERSWDDEEHARSIHLEDMSSAASLRIDYELAEPVAPDEVVTWYEHELRGTGWVRADTNTFCRQLGERKHTMTIAADSTPDAYELDYRIGFEGEGTCERATD
jgi:hypothetical protein